MNKIYLLIISILVSYIGISQPMNQTDSKGLKTGKWQKTFDNGKVKYQGQFENGYEIGDFFYYYPNGKVQSKISYSEKGNRSTVILYYKSGAQQAIGSYYKKQKQGNWKFFSETTEELLSEENYQNGKKHGAFITYYYQSKQIASQLNYLNDLKEGAWKEFFEDGTPKLSATYVKDTLQGEFLTWYANGKLCRKGQYVNGKSNGLWTTYTEQGQNKKMERYKMGFIQMEREFENGVIVYEKDFTTNKVIIDTRKKVVPDGEE